ncbi:hypothetical protein COT97_01965 [Candidatus Falkowbacteria bacterium CG10_big_fil_rev_8_21_14_0_10_39_11]|uniref:Uncharacterized protein n=1 Tax=Candidatus Falkowbacteria bacterium CG10_big_fil_rev_8_21_14_0_10_39_11 TaxID=1974565 RepID=A0A2H0V563_9BACT|nr:MAG: hypothetical protein COT97_01965 [Candidatus Falkowbacteria bacterium CG10_big_fil_rev_8_21_14_0_10_39_11]
MNQDRLHEEDRSSFDGNQENYSDFKRNNSAPNSFKDLNHKQIILGSMLVMIFVLIVVVMGVNAKSFFDVPIPNADKLTKQKDGVTAEDMFKTEADLIAAEKQKDTDEDGLSDYDELNLWKTSPYLIDSDSDGLTDQVEVELGSDPNCPEGKECAKTSFTENLSPKPQDVTGEEAPTAAEIRVLLVGAGLFTNEELAVVGDGELISIYNEILAQENAATTTTTTTTPEKTDPQSYTIEELKQVLRDSGVDEETISAVSDEELRGIFQDAWSAASGS